MNQTPDPTPNQTPTKPRRQIRAADVWDFFKPSVIVLVVMLLLFKGFLMLCTVPSASMEPTLPVRSAVLCGRLDYRFTQPQRGDVVVFHWDQDGDARYFIKRLIALPGETVQITGGVTYIDGQPLAEPWLTQPPLPLDFGPVTVPPDEYFFLGDNRNNSWDGRYWDDPFVPRQDLAARAWCSVHLRYGFRNLLRPAA